MKKDRIVKNAITEASTLLIVSPENIVINAKKTRLRGFIEEAQKKKNMILHASDVSLNLLIPELRKCVYDYFYVAEEDVERLQLLIHFPPTRFDGANEVTNCKESKHKKCLLSLWYFTKWWLSRGSTEAECLQEVTQITLLDMANVMHNVFLPFLKENATHQVLCFSPQSTTPQLPWSTDRDMCLQNIDTKTYPNTGIRLLLTVSKAPHLSDQTNTLNAYLTSPNKKFAENILLKKLLHEVRVYRGKDSELVHIANVRIDSETFLSDFLDELAAWFATI